MKPIIAVMILAMFNFGCGTWPTTEQAMTPKQRGEARARADIATGKMRILYYGKPWSVGKPLKDDRTGLPVEIVEGCDVSAEFVAETDAYNAVMREAGSTR